MLKILPFFIVLLIGISQESTGDSNSVSHCTKRTLLTMISQSKEQNSDSYRKLALFHLSLYNYRRVIPAEKVLEQPGDINYQYPANALLKARKSEFIGSTSLHLAQKCKKKKLVDSMFQVGADFTIKNSRGFTVLHQSIQRIYDDFKDGWRQGWFQAKVKDKVDFGIPEAILDAHVQFKNTKNPRDNNGISHFHIACVTDHSKAVEFFLTNGISVNHAVNEDSPILSGYTPLHIAGICGCSDLVKILLKHGADRSLKNKEGMTPLRSVVSRNMEVTDWMHTRDTTLFCFSQLKKDIEDRDDVIKLLLLSENTDRTNVIDDVGFSYFHAACTLNDTSIAKEFLETSVVDLRQSVRMDSPVWPGYTALHFAAHFNVEMVKLLVSKGADMETKDFYGVSPFDICVERFSIEDLHSILSSHSVWKDIRLSDGKAKLIDLVYILQDYERMDDILELEDIDINTFVPVDSPIWPGCTILHLAVMFTETIKIVNYDTSDDDDSDDLYDNWSMGSDNDKRLSKRRYQTSILSYNKRIEICLDRDADVTAKDARGFTPIHLAFRLQKLEAVKLMLNFQPETVNHTDNDNLSHLYIACFIKYQNLVEKLLANEANVNISILPTFQWHKNVNSFLNKYRSSGFKNGGSTPLHAAVISGAEDIVKMLLEHGADLNAKDDSGLTPLHQIFSQHYNHKIADMLLASPALKDSVFNDGLTHLHLASFFGSLSAVERLLGNGANIDATISVTSNSTFRHYDQWSVQPLSFMNEYSGCTPLHIAMGLHNGDIHLPHRNGVIAKLLLQRGADPFIKNSAGRSVAYMSLGMRHLKMRDDVEIPFLETDISLQKRMIDDSGITMLHIACWKVDVDMVKKLLSQGDDVNAQAHEDSPVWPKWTPMHVLMLMGANSKIDSSKIDEIWQVLLDNGADLTLVNAELDTPLHLTEPGILSVEIASHVSYRSYANSPYAGFILEKLKDCIINPTSIAGISHFHIASLRNDVKNVKKFLQHGVDVNKPIDFFSDRYPGSTALHLALSPDTNFDNSLRVESIKLLLKHGADVQVRDIHGNTPIHLAFRRGFPGEALLEPIFSAGADLNTINMRGETAFEVLLKSGNVKSEEIRYILQRGARINDYNSYTDEGYIAMTSTGSLIRDIIDNWEEVLEIDNSGRNSIHNIVSLRGSRIENYVELIGTLMRRGCDIDRQDKQGRTPLHLAVKFTNTKAISALPALGADVNLADSDGKTAFAKIYEDIIKFPFCGSVHKEIIKTLATHVRKMQLCGQKMHELNGKILTDSSRLVKVDEDDLKKYDEEIAKAKSVKIDSSEKTVYDFLSGKIDMVAYKAMSDIERIEFDEFLSSIDTKKLDDDFPEFAGVMRFQYQKFKDFNRICRDC